MAAARLTPSTVLLLLVIPTMCLAAFGYVDEVTAALDSPLGDRFPEGSRGGRSATFGRELADQLAFVGINRAMAAADHRDYDGALRWLDRSLVLAQSAWLRDYIQKRQARVAMGKQLLSADKMIHGSQWREAKAALDEIVRQPLDPEDREIVDARMRVVEKRLAAKRR